MATTSSYKLRSFTINGSDLSFLYSQVTFKPLFDKNGVPIVNWAGTTAIYDINGKKLYDPNDLAFNATQGLSAIDSVTAALAYFGTSYDSVTDASGLRNVSGLMNNIIQGHSHWGQADTPFIRLVKADFNSYTKTYAPDTTDASYGNNFAAGQTAYDSLGVAHTTTARTMTTDYSTTKGVNGAVVQHTVTDYTPRMISLLTTTAGVTYDTDPVTGRIVFTNGLAQVKDWGMLSADNGGQIDYQNRDGVTAKLDAYGHLVKDANGVVQTLNNHDANGNITNPEQFVGSINPGVSPNNGWFALFGQFFDHGLDFVAKGGQTDGGKVTKVVIALSPTDPLYVAPAYPGDPNAVTSMTISRATVAGFDAKGDPYYNDHDSPYIDQSQTYGSNSQITNFLREWVSTDGGNTYHAGTNLFNGSTSVAWTKADGSTTHETLPTINELRAQLLATHRSDLTWEDISNFRNRDATGNVQVDAFGKLVNGTSGSALLLDMNPHFDVTKGTNTSGHITQSLLNQINAQAVKEGLLITPTNPTAPLKYYDANNQLSTDANGNLPLYPGNGPSLFDLIDFATFNPVSTLSATMKALVGELLLESVGDHYVAGDGRVNENIGLTAIHHVWHEEHNYQVANLEASIAAQDAAATLKGDATHTTLHNWQIQTDVMDAQGNYRIGSVTGAISWDPEKIFNASKLLVEMEYQHVAVDQYARSVTPNLPEFVGYNSNIDASISDEFAQVAFRFGHTTIRETIDTIDPTGGLTGRIMSLTLKDSFLNPSLFASVGAGSIALGMSHQQMNAVDEFVTPALNQGLLGQPLDLAAINIARGRDMGMATLNEMRAALGSAGKQNFAAYANWSEFAQNMNHPDNLVNFIAAYSYDGDLQRAAALLNLFNTGTKDAADEAYMVSKGYTYTLKAASDMMLVDKGIDHVDAWLGGLAERCVLGGLLGETFDAIFLDQIERLMDGDRFYYLYRLVGQQIGDQIGNEQFKDIVERNTGVTHLNGNIFAYADQYYDLSTKALSPSTQGIEHKYADALSVYEAANPGKHIGVFTDGTNNTGLAAEALNGTLQTISGKQYIYDLRPEMMVGETNLDGTPTTGANSSEVLVGTAYDDYISMQGGDDTAYGDGGNDIIYGGDGMDKLYGGTGNDTIFGGEGPDVIDGGDGNDLIYGQGSGTAMNGSDQLIGGSGNDTIYGGDGIDKLSGESGDDVIYGGADTDPFTHGGDGNDFIDGGSSGDLLYGDNGDDIILGGSDQDVLEGDNGDDILRPGPMSAAALAAGPDEVWGGDGVTDTGFDIMDLSDWALSPTGVTADFATQSAPQATVKGGTNFPAWFQVEGLVATANNDTIIGDANGNWLIGGSGNDTITGGAGNDVIIGNSIRLDTLDGTYQVGGTNTAYSFSIDGATNRAGSAVTGATLASNGLLDSNTLKSGGVALFDKHFTDMLSTELFKNTVLGDDVAQVGGSGTGKNMAVYSGAHTDYTFTKVTYTSQNEGAITNAYKVVDKRGDTFTDANGIVQSGDGTDLVVGIDYFQFSDGVYTATGTKITPTVMQAPAPSGGLLQIGSNPVALPAAGVSTNENSTSSIVSLVASGATGSQFAISLNRTQNDSDLFQISKDAVTGNWNLSFKAGANFESLTHAPTYTVNLISTDTTLGISSEQLLTVNLSNLNETATGSIDITGYSVAKSGANNVAKLNAVNLAYDPDLVSPSNPTGAITGVNATGTTEYQWESSTNGTTWTKINGATGASYTAPTSAGLYRVTTTYTDPFGVQKVISGQTATVGTNSGTTMTASGSQSLMLGLDGNDTMTGTAGNDTLDGGAGNDSMSGGLGNDIYVVDSGTDAIFENAGVNTGTDTVYSSVSYTLPANVENLVLTGTANINGTGNTLDNAITGNTGNNILSGLAGNDTLTGSGGNDTLIGGTGDDTYVVTAQVTNAVNTLTITENANEGTDTIQSSTTFTLASLTNIENLTLTGSAGINGTGNTLANVITGNSGNNSLLGGAGNDTLIGGGGTDTLVGGADNDTYIVDTTSVVIAENASEGTDTVQSSVTFSLAKIVNVENLTLTGTGNIDGSGNSLANVITGNAGNNQLYGGGNDILIGGNGNDTYYINAIGNTLTEQSNEGIDTVISSIDFTLGNNLDNLTLTGLTAINGTGNSLDNYIIGNEIDNVLTGSAGNDTLNGGLGKDTLIGGAGNDIYDVDTTTDVITEDAGLAGGIDTVRAYLDYSLLNVANVENLTLMGAALNGTGNAGDNVITGNAGNNSLSGGAGNDTLIGGGGNDTLNGGADNDTYIVDSQISSNYVFDSLGTDTIQSSVSFSLADFNNANATIENLTLTGSAIGGTGNSLDNFLTGNSGNNILDGGTGVDTMAGGAGDDTYYVDNAGDVMIENASQGTDTVFSSLTYAISTNLENLTLTGTNNINGIGNDVDNVLTGNSGNNSLSGGLGNDTLIGGKGNDTLDGGAGIDTASYASATSAVTVNLTTSLVTGGDGNDTLSNIEIVIGSNLNDTFTGRSSGADTMSGGLGDDSYNVNNLDDVIIENANEGADTVISSLTTYALGNNIENLTLIGSAINGTGNTLNNLIIGNSAVNTLVGDAGDDTLNGGGGVDTLNGGDGNDTYIVTAQQSTTTVVDSSGTDTIQSSADFTLATLTYIENLTLTGSAINGTGNTVANVITGNASNNVLDGGTGADTMIGGAGNDTYTVDNAGDVVTENANEGTDTVNSSVTYTLAANIENLTLTGITAINGTGNTGNNVLTGNTANNNLSGGAGNDTLISGGGTDTLVGGIGDDTYRVVNTQTVVTENANLTLAGFVIVNEGVDTVEADITSGTYTLGANIEKLILLGSTANINGTGNTEKNTITGNSGNNVLDGGTGADTMIGGLGNDTYVVDNTGDVVTENANEGTDAVNASVNYTLAANIENLTLTGTGNINGTGNTANNTINGNAGNNVIDGGAGADAMIGGAGNDTYTVDNVGDVVTEAIGGGTDIVNSSVTFTLSADVETLNLTGTLAINGTGNAGVNTIVGNSAANILNGGLGNDTLTGGGGNDYFVFDSAPSGNVDTITDFSKVTGNTDFLQFSKKVFATTTASGGGAGTELLVAEFSSGAGRTTALNATTHFIYNTTDGALYYDADGQNGAAAVQVAIIGNKPANFANTDIHIIA